jgi:hypothetical protein
VEALTTNNHSTNRCLDIINHNIISMLHRLTVSIKILMTRRSYRVMQLDIHHKTSRTPNNIMFKIHFLHNIQLLHSLNIINRSTKSIIGQEEVLQSEDEEELQDLIRFLIKWLSLGFLKISSIEASRCIISNPIYTNSHMKDRCSWRVIMAKHQLSTGPCNKEGIIIRISTKSNNLFHSRHNK